MLILRPALYRCMSQRPPAALWTGQWSVCNDGGEKEPKCGSEPGLNEAVLPPKSLRDFMAMTQSVQTIVQCPISLSCDYEHRDSAECYTRRFHSARRKFGETLIGYLALRFSVWAMGVSLKFDYVVEWTTLKFGWRRAVQPDRKQPQYRIESCASHSPSTSTLRLHHHALSGEGACRPRNSPQISLTTFVARRYGVS
jgi:hypothetical protein